MSISNNVQLIGNVGNDIDFKTTENGLRVATFSMATHERRKDENGQRINVTEWHNIVCYDSLAELVQKYLKKGSKCSLVGRLRTTKYDDKQNVTHYTTRIVAEDVLFLDNKQ